MRRDSEDHNTRHIRWLAGIVLLALAVRLLAFAAFSPWDETVVRQNVLHTDAKGFHSLALQVIESWTFEKFEVSQGAAFRTPGYPVFLGAIYTVFGVKPWVVLLTQIILDAVTVILLYLFSRRFFSPNVSLIACAIYAVEPHVVIYCVSLLSDSLFVFLFLAGLLVFVIALKNDRVSYYAGTGVLFGLASLVRPTAQFYLVALSLFVFLLYHVSWTRRTLAVVALALAFTATISPWLYRNYTSYGTASLSAQGGDFLLNWVAAYTEAARSARPIESVRAEFEAEAIKRGYDETDDPFDRSRIQTKIATEYISQHFLYYLARHAAGIAHTFLNLDTRQLAQIFRLKGTTLATDFFSAPSGNLGMVVQFLRQKSPHEIAIGGAVALFLVLVYSASVAGAWFAFQDRKYDYLIIATISIIYFCAFIGPIGIARYKLPMIPLYLPLAAYGLTTIYSRFRSRRIKPA